MINASRPGAGVATHVHVPKLCGADTELGNFILGSHAAGTAATAARALLQEVETTYTPPLPYSAAGSRYDPQDWGRRYLSSNGGCVYIDLDHLELCLPEVTNARDHLASWHAMLRIARRALEAANAKLPPGQTLQVLVNNSDGHGHAYGSHLDFLISRAAFDNLFDRKLHHLLFLAAYQASSIIFTGQGKVGAEHGQPAVAFQLAQRADFFETLTGPQTTSRRPLVNSRDEPLCGSPQALPALARLHCIFYDNTLCHVSSFLKVGVMQIILAMLEAGCVDTALILDDPLDAVVRWSHDPTLAARATLMAGAPVTALDLQLRFADAAAHFVAAGGCDGLVPQADDILALWEDTLRKLQAGDVFTLASRLDWVLKFRILHAVLRARPALTWASPQIKHLDHLYSSLDGATGLYWAYERHGCVEALVSAADIERFVHEPPDDTRAWLRAHLLRRGGEAVYDVEWDRITFRTRGRDGWPVVRVVQLADPLGHTRAASAHVIDRAGALDDILEALSAAPPETAERHQPAIRWPVRGNGRAAADWDEC